MGYALLGDVFPGFWVIAALACCFIGDLILMFPSTEKRFTAGLLAFLSGHLAFILAFLTQNAQAISTHPAFFLWAVPLALYAALIYRLLSPFVGALKPAIILYIVLITGMGLSSLTSLLAGKGMLAACAILGALLFITSDTGLAMARFRKTNISDITIMLTYGLAQMLLTLWFSGLP